MNKGVQIIGIPIDLGQSHRGVDLGPGAVRYANLAARLEELGYEVHDSGNLIVPVRESLTHEKDMVFRKSNYICNRTVLINCSKASSELNRDLIDKLKKTDKKFTLLFELDDF